MLGKDFYLHTSHLIAAIILVAMGILVIVLATTGRTWTSTSYLASMTSIFGVVTTAVIEKTKFIPEFIWISLAILVILLIVWRAVRPKSVEDKEKE